MVRPVVARPAPAHALDGDAVAGAEAVGAQDKLDEGVGEEAAVGYAMAGLRVEGIC